MNTTEFEDPTEELKASTAWNGIEYEKYLSLINILKGQEEFLLNGQGLIISSNLETVNVTGYEEYEMLGKHISILYASDDSEKCKEDLIKTVTLGQITTSGIRMKKRGVAFWAKMKIHHLNSNDPQGPCFKVILQDATHRAISNERVRTIKDEYLSIFNNPFVGTFKFRMDNFRIQMCNQKTLDIMGRKKSFDLTFDSFFNIPEQFDEFMTMLRKDKRVEGYKFLIRDANNSQNNWAVLSARYFELQGFAEGVLVDISEQHNQMLELQRLNIELDNFTYHASHDLRAPLTSMLGLVNLAKNESNPATTQNYLEMIGGRVQHLDSLLKDLVAVSHNYRAELTYQNFDFRSEVDSTLKLLEDPFSVVKINVDVQQECDFATDPIRLRTILRNLLSNALKYYNPDQTSPWINLEVKVDKDQAFIQVQDNGIGIDAVFKAKIFDMFFRATDRSSGSGLGLYIVKSVVEKLKGKIQCESTKRVGTTFRVTLPNCVKDVEI